MQVFDLYFSRRPSLSALQHERYSFFILYESIWPAWAARAGEKFAKSVALLLVPDS